MSARERVRWPTWHPLWPVFRSCGRLCSPAPHAVSSCHNGGTARALEVNPAPRAGAGGCARRHQAHLAQRCAAESMPLIENFHGGRLRIAAHRRGQYRADALSTRRADSGGQPLAGTLVAATFLKSLVPVVGNFVSNIMIVAHSVGLAGLMSAPVSVRN